MVYINAALAIGIIGGLGEYQYLRSYVSNSENRIIANELRWHYAIKAIGKTGHPSAHGFLNSLDGDSTAQRFIREALSDLK